MQIKIFNTRIVTDADVRHFENIVNQFIETEINQKNKVVYDIRQTEVPFGRGNEIVTVLTLTLTYEEAQK